MWRSNAILDEDQVEELYITDCYMLLQSARAKIEATCTAETDIIVYKNVVYPAMFIADNYLLMYNVFCIKDAWVIFSSCIESFLLTSCSNGNYCDPIFFSWANKTFYPSANILCSDCWLDVLAVQLNNPLGYDKEMNKNFNLLISSCNATGYSITSPTVYVLNTTATAPATTVSSIPTATPMCVSTYKAQSSDDCNSVAKAVDISIYYLLQANDLDLYCQIFADQVNQTFCVPSQCDIYTWQASDICDSIVSSLYNVTLTQFFVWNPNFNSLCLNSPFFIGYEICLR